MNNLKSHHKWIKSWRSVFKNIRTKRYSEAMSKANKPWKYMVSDDGRREKRRKRMKSSISIKIN